MIIELIDDLRGEVGYSPHALIVGGGSGLKLESAAEVEHLEYAAVWIVDGIFQFDVSGWGGEYLCMMPLLWRWLTASST